MRLSNIITVPLLAFAASTASAQNINSLLGDAKSLLNGLPLSSLVGDITAHAGEVSSIAAAASSYVRAHQSQLESLYSKYGTNLPPSIGAEYTSALAAITKAVESGTGSGGGSGGGGGSSAGGNAAGFLSVPSLPLTLMGAAAIGIFGAAVAL